MILNKRLSFIQNDWFIAAIILIVFLLTNGYQYGWDDQHLEIPLLKSLIDPELYQGDYYVESLKKNFSSFFYPILAKVITVRQIPIVYLVLFLISRYFLFFWAYKLWRLISKEKVTAFLCTLIFILLSRVPEFLYRTFSHQEFTFAVIFAGIYYFYKERFILAAIILGLAANIHALYSLFPMTYLGGYLLWQHKRHGIKMLITASLAFLTAALPFLIWTIQSKIQAVPVETYLEHNWYFLYQVAAPQVFMFNGLSLEDLLVNPQAWLTVLKDYWLLGSLLLLNSTHNASFKTDLKTRTMVFVAIVVLAFTYYFTYIIPKEFVLALNLIRNMQFLHFFLIGYTTVLFISLLKEGKPALGYALGLCLGLFQFGAMISALSVLTTHFLINISKNQNRHRSILLNTFGIGACLLGIIYIFSNLILPANKTAAIMIRLLLATLPVTLVYFALRRQKSHANAWKLSILFVILPVLVSIGNFVHYHIKHITIERQGGGFWDLQRHWEDMQRYVQGHTPKEALFLVPYDMEMGGFRIHSERKLIVCYRDCGIIAFDYNAMLEWQRRIHDIKEFTVMPKAPKKAALINALAKYHADYIVFMYYDAPQENLPWLKKVYVNSRFALFKVEAQHLPRISATE